MAAPTKNLIYLSGVQLEQARILKPAPPVPGAQKALLRALAPAFWRPVLYRMPQSRGGRLAISRRVQHLAMTSLRKTVFWRQSDAAPLKGQRYPLSR